METGHPITKLNNIEVSVCLGACGYVFSLQHITLCV